MAAIEAEPDWNDIEGSKTWLEARYPLLDDTSFGSPLFRYIKECVKYPHHTPGRTTKFLASMLSFDEMLRHDKENDVILTFDPFQTKLYPYYGFPEQDRAPEPTWNDTDASKTWLEQRYPLGPHSSGSPLYRYMHACRESRHYICSSTAVLGSMLTGGEWVRFCTAYPGSVRPLHLDTSNPIILYPEYDQMTWPEQGPGERASATPTKILPANPSRKRGNEVLDDKQLASSHYKKMRASPGAGGVESSPSVKIPLAGPSRKRSIENVEGAPTTNSSPKRKRTRSTSGHSSTSGGSSIDGLGSPSRGRSTYARRPFYGVGSPSRGRSTSVGMGSSGGSPFYGLGSPFGGSSISVGRETSGGRSTTGDNELRPYSPGDPPPPNFSDTECSPFRSRSTSRVNELRPYSPGDPPSPNFSDAERSPSRSRSISRVNYLRANSPGDLPPPGWSPLSEKTYTGDRAEGRTPDPASLRHKSPSYEPPEPDLASLRQESPYEPPEPDLASLRQESPYEPPEPDLASFRQESPSYGAAEPQGEHHIHVKEESKDIAMDSENPRDQTTDHVLENGGDRTVQTAISVIIPMQKPQRQAAANQAPSSDEDNANDPLLQRRGKEGQKSGPKGRKASNSKPQRKQGKRESTMGQKNRQLKPESQQSAYMRRLRSGVGERKQRKPRLVILEFEGRKAVQAKAN